MENKELRAEIDDGYRNAALKDKRVKQEYFMCIALINCLKRGVGYTRNGYTYPKTGRKKEFKNTIIEVMKSNNCYDETIEALLRNI